MHRTAAATAVGSLLIAVTVGCAAQPTEVAPTPSASPVETPAEATESQVASVIAKHAPDWQETIDGAYDCRFTWVLGADSGDVLTDGEAFVCMMQETTIGITAQTAVRDLEALSIPSSMEELVDETVSVLTLIGDTDLESLCGTADYPADTDECNGALSSRLTAYSLLEDALAAWSPYL